MTFTIAVTAPDNPQSAELRTLNARVEWLTRNPGRVAEFCWSAPTTPYRDAFGRMREAATQAGIDHDRKMFADLISWAADGPAARAARGAAWALACRHLIGGVFRQQDYDTLTAPWVAVMGPVHPQDQRAREAA